MAEEIKDTAVVEEEAKKPAEDKAAKKTKKSDKKAKKAKGRNKVTSYIKDLKSELGKITWYSRKDTVKSTILVCVVMVVVAAIIGLVDLLFGKGVDLLGGLSNLF